MANISDSSAVRIHVYVLKRCVKTWPLLFRPAQRRGVPGSLCVVNLKAFAVLACSPLGMLSIDGRGKFFPIFMVKVRDIFIEDAAVIGKGKFFWGGILLHKCRLALLAV